jgi:hypothetical protein
VYPFVDASFLALRFFFHLGPPYPTLASHGTKNFGIKWSSKLQMVSRLCIVLSFYIECIWTAHGTKMIPFDFGTQRSIVLDNEIAKWFSGPSDPFSPRVIKER